MCSASAPRPKAMKSPADSVMTSPRATFGKNATASRTESTGDRVPSVALSPNLTIRSRDGPESSPACCGEPTDCEGESEVPPDEADGRPQRHEQDQAGRVQHVYDDHTGDTHRARQDPEEVERGKPALPQEDRDAET